MIIIVYTDSLCSLRLIPRMQGVLGITLDCNGQCALTSTFQTNQCVDLVNDLGIQCSQASCTTRAYNLSACVTAENGMIVGDMTVPSNDRGNSTVNDMTTEQPQASTVFGAETTSRTEAQDISCTTKPQSSTQAQYYAVIGALVGLVIILLAMAVVPWIWIGWRLKMKGGLQKDKQRQR